MKYIRANLGFKSSRLKEKKINILTWFHFHWIKNSSESKNLIQLNLRSIIIIKFGQINLEF
jgi:hypothetical protein